MREEKDKLTFLGIRANVNASWLKVFAVCFENGFLKRSKTHYWEGEREVG